MKTRRFATDRHNAGLYGVMYGTSRRHQRASEDAELMREWKAHEEWVKSQKETKRCQS